MYRLAHGHVELEYDAGEGSTCDSKYHLRLVEALSGNESGTASPFSHRLRPPLRAISIFREQLLDPAA